jgi:aspartate carbamoyltransferase regulatory subunit
MSSKEELYVRKIESGTVIDHITAGHSLDVLRILKINGRGDNVVSIVINVPSKKAGRKDIVKVDHRELRPEEVDKIALVAPNATINIVRDFEVVDKKKVKLPRLIKGIIKCDNPTCVSNANEPVESIFLVEQAMPLRARCHYCTRIMESVDILKQF